MYLLVKLLNKVKFRKEKHYLLAFFWFMKYALKKHFASLFLPILKV